ncbi:MAG TPA: helix-turn-helix domain-containing protein [Rhizomicrobium sp.]|nr:helix-turn-helix domain-containing protein [Rhizomicrobium sp.]
MTESKIDALLRITSLSALPRTLLGRMAAAAGLQRIGKGSTLFREGERAHFVYGLVEGTVALEGGPQSGETIADFLESGDILLVPPALLQLPYMVTARAVTDLVVVLLPAEEFRHLAETEISLSSALNRALSAHWRFLLRHLTCTKSRDADTRLVEYLINLSGRSAGSARINLPGSKKELAAHLGMTPATLSRSLKRLSSLGVRTSGTDIEIEDMTRLCSAHALPVSQQWPTSP